MFVYIVSESHVAWFLPAETENPMLRDNGREKKK